VAVGRARRASGRSRPFPLHRRVVVHALRRGRQHPAMVGLITVDITDTDQALRSLEPPGSLTALVIAAVGRAVAAHPEVRAYRSWSGRLRTPTDVHVAALVEVPRPDGSTAGIAHVVTSADQRDVADIGAELHAVRATPGGHGAVRALRWEALGRVPGLLRLLLLTLDRSPRARARTGTVAVTAIGMFGAGQGGFGVAAPTTTTLSVVVGGRHDAALVVDGEVAIRRALDLTISADHTVVDGAPVARFVADLRRLLADPGLVSDPGRTPPP
jgi:pyruvate/2-oxoglutarate dehydrogenase complex dihydrolipoamide acyltransferase (E2) component